MSEQAWLNKGYELFAIEGPAALKVENMSRIIGVSKSSFYHHFPDKELFIQALMNRHLKQSAVLAAKELAVNKIDPELIDILLEHRIDLLFSRQLRFNQQYSLYCETLQQSNLIVGTEFIAVWRKDLQLQLTMAQLSGLFELALENFFLQLHPDNMNREWLTAYFQNLKRIASSFSVVDGSV